MRLLLEHEKDFCLNQELERHLEVEFQDFLDRYSYGAIQEFTSRPWKLNRRLELCSEEERFCLYSRTRSFLEKHPGLINNFVLRFRERIEGWLRQDETTP